MKITPAKRRLLVFLMLGVIGFVGYKAYKHDDGVIRTYGKREYVVQSSPTLTNNKQLLSFVVVGDTGLASEARKQVVNAMTRATDLDELDFVFLVGDNFYDAGVKSVDDPRFKSDFEDAFPISSLACPFYVCLGNHDYYGNVQAQIEYTKKSERWRMPANYYCVSETVGSNTIDFFVLDTMPIHEGDFSTRAQICWLEDRLSKSTADWKIVVGHHPILSGGEHGACRKNRRSLEPLFKKYKVDLYVSGHDHDLQLNQSTHGWLQLVSGAGSKLRSTRWIDQTLFAEAKSGFSWVVIQDDQLFISFFGINGHLFTHCQTKKHVALASRQSAKLPN